jgi:mycothiol synthase
VNQRPITEADADAVAAIVVADSEALTSRPSRLGPNDVRAAIEEAFRDHWEWHGTPFEKWWELRRDNDQSLWFVIRDGTEIAAAIRNDAERNGGGYVGIIGVRRAWRGRGLAKALLLRTFGEFRRRGTKRVSLDVDADSPTGATRLYESVGMHVEGAMAVYER